jgi:hypothetical protein
MYKDIDIPSVLEFDYTNYNRVYINLEINLILFNLFYRIGVDIVALVLLVILQKALGALVHCALFIILIGDRNEH